MSNSVKTPKPSTAPFDSQFEKEESRVQRKALDPARTDETVSERTLRIDHKMSVAALLLERLPATDKRARLLGSAMLRRDEVLLDAVLAGMTDEVVGLVSGSRTRRP